MAHSAVYIPALLLSVAMFAACSRTVIEADPPPQKDTTTSPGVKKDTNLLVTLQEVSIFCTYYAQEMGVTRPRFIIRTQTEYEEMQRLLLATPRFCSDSTFPEIDFSRYTLLGNPVEVSGCYLRVPISRTSIEWSKSKKSIRLRIVGITREVCTGWYSVTSWVIVPPIPVDYTVEVDIEVLEE